MNYQKLNDWLEYGETLLNFDHAREKLRKTKENKSYFSRIYDDESASHLPEPVLDSVLDDFCGIDGFFDCELFPKYMTTLFYEWLADAVPDQVVHFDKYGGGRADPAHQGKLVIHVPRGKAFSNFFYYSDIKHTLSERRALLRAVQIRRDATIRELCAQLYLRLVETLLIPEYLKRQRGEASDLLDYGLMIISAHCELVYRATGRDFLYMTTQLVYAYPNVIPTHFFEIDIEEK